MNGNGGDATIGMPELLVRAALPDLPKAEALQKCHHLARLEDGWLRHWSGHDGLDADELGFELRFTVLQEKGDDFLQVAIEFVERLGLAMGAGKAGHVSDVDTGVRIAFDDCGIGLRRPQARKTRSLSSGRRGPTASCAG